MRRSNAYSLCSVFLLVAASLTTTVVGQTRSPARLENELTIKPSPTPTPTLGPTLMADPMLIPPDTPRNRPHETQSDPAYYIKMRGISGLRISDDRGNTDDLFKFPFVQTVRSATYDSIGDDSIFIITPVDRTYSITIQSKSAWMQLEIVKGIGNSAPDEAIRYCDLKLGGKTARFEITPLGVKPLRVDTNDDGRYDSVVGPTASLRGRSAKDTEGPKVRFRVLKRNATSLLISIETRDEATAVKSVTYTVDGYHLFSYKSPFRIQLGQASSLFAWADDYSGNRTVAVFQQDVLRRKF